MGFRWQYVIKDGSPFRCEDCTDENKITLNCGNSKGLSENAKAVTSYTEEIKSEIEGIDKVFSVGNIRLYECPLTYISTDTHDLMRLAYLIDDTKQLFYAGGWSEQPYWLIDAYEILKSVQAENRKGNNG